MYGFLKLGEFDVTLGSEANSTQFLVAKQPLLGGLI
jgi:hypothetical protein